MTAPERAGPTRPAGRAGPARLRAVLFDLDGTLVDPTPGVTSALRATAVALGLPVPAPEVVRRFIGPPVRDGFASLLHLPPERVQTAVDVFRDAYARSGILDCVVYPGVRELLGRLRDRGLRLAVATSKPEPFASTVLEHTRLLPSFAAVCAATLDGAVHSKEQVVRAALRALAVDPGGAVLVGDRALDVVGAAAAGLACVGAGWGHGAAGELHAAGAAAVADDPVAVLAVLDRWAAAGAPARSGPVAPLTRPATGTAPAPRG